jgi:hypothetical protein
MAGFWSDFSLSTFLTSIVGSGLTAGLIVKGLSTHLTDRWLARYKRDLDKEFESYRDKLEQKRKRLEAELSHRVYTTQTQFDTEFNSIKDIFAALGKLKLAFNGSRPFMDSLVPDDKEEVVKMISDRLRQLKERFNTVIDTAESVFPFVPEDIYSELEICMQSALLEIRSIEYAGSEALSSDGYSEGRKHHERFSAAYFKAAKLARERFKSMAVVSN